MSEPSFTPVVLSGGSGTRLWPLSRTQYPKQFLALEGGGRTLLQETLLRLDGALPGVARAAPLLVCNEEHRFLAAQQLREIGCDQPRIVLEPMGRNTAPALTLAALLAEPGTVLLAMPADHVMTRPAGLHQALATAWPLAVAGGMVTFGIVAARAETGYGYIQAGAADAGHPGAFAIHRFTEKPDLALARQYVQSGDHYWNSGLFMIRADQWLKAVAALQPEILAACRKAVADCARDLDFIRIAAESFAASPSNSIDYAVMEPLGAHPELGVPGFVVPADPGWSDLGAWDALWGVLPRDAHGNAVRGEVRAVDTRGSLLFSQHRLLATVGVEDLVVVETADAVLVASRREAQQVREIVAALGAENHPLLAAHRKVYRPWGWYDGVDCGERFQVKRIVVNPGAQLSLQKHHHRAEHWVVVRGTAEVTCDERQFLLSENQSTYIPLGSTHRLGNPGKVPLELIEVQSGAYLGEDDIVRYEDHWGRAPEGASRQ